MIGRPRRSPLFPYTTLFRSDVGPQRADPVSQPLLEANVLGVAKPPVCVECRRIVGAHVEHDMVAELKQSGGDRGGGGDRKSTRLNSSHLVISYAVFCLEKKK